ncbi:anaphase-promoting complex subunit 10 [Punctularia strigosozonata HHB-11173 SS5]|uniref:Anaphase-promoting complex subunit 10 n=1 Tax=Punctularia strigosozonata (strain HHB-11173) TaxID=741275 RepID=R7S3Z5_PUNST|nr:anaphase-promoting complex subunit 10 [Punctularia strigosozonata HHB-11173 SS5]EIN04933.1 anaphase-promoting complex subunit 10 [Punctularia strigosozonata HHB-11173 SS5]
MTTPSIAFTRSPTAGANTQSVHVATPSDGTTLLHAVRYAPRLPWPDIGRYAKWSVSSFKYGFGAECLIDNDPDTFWHSDGPQPHFITVEFPRKMAIQKLSIYLSFPLDDSYTPSTLAIRAGTGPSDLQDVRVLTLDKPDGWITFDISSEASEEGEGFKPVHAYVLQIIIVTNHMNGKDTHVRGLRVLGPLEEMIRQPQNLPLDQDPFPWSSAKFKMYQTIR